MRSIPSQPILVGECIGGVCDQVDVGGKRVLLGKKFLGPLIEIGRRSGINQKHLYPQRRKLSRILHKVVYLAGAVWALIARITTEDDEARPYPAA